GYEETEKMCELNLTAPTQTARVNRIKATREEVLAQLEDEGFAAKASPFIPEAIHSLRGNLAHSNAFKSGLLTIQDESSMLAAYALA
ncbi:16S rRNA (cytosine(967)-C(5))-methyltransferase, partial [Pseudomonas sp. MPR-R5A]